MLLSDLPKGGTTQNYVRTMLKFTKQAERVFRLFKVQLTECFNMSSQVSVFGVEGYNSTFLQNRLKHEEGTCTHCTRSSCLHFQFIEGCDILFFHWTPQSALLGFRIYSWLTFLLYSDIVQYCIGIDLHLIHLQWRQLAPAIDPPRTPCEGISGRGQ